MADPAQLDQSSTQRQVSELPMGPSVVGAYAHAAAHNATTAPQPSSRLGRKRPPSSARSVSVDFFDPEGVEELRREMSRASEALGSQTEEASVSEDSDHTLQDGRFDLEKTLRHLTQQ